MDIPAYQEYINKSTSQNANIQVRIDKQFTEYQFARLSHPDALNYREELSDRIRREARRKKEERRGERESIFQLVNRKRNAVVK